MNNKIKKLINKIKTDGYCYIENQLKKQDCDKLICDLEKILILRKKKSLFIGNKYTRMLISYFYENNNLLKLISFNSVDLILKELIDEHYVLISSNAMDASINEKFKTKKDFTPGSNWHTDSRFVGGVRLDKGFNFLVILALDDFTINNGATLFIPRSHLVRKKITNFDKAKPILIKKGTIAILDAALWHRRGDLNNIRRWSIFSMYGPWFMKPYYNFCEMFGKKINSFSKKQKKLLHYNSTPPKSHFERISTLNY
jgi:hypothetical protein